jgi:hypothetical protein
LIHPAKPRPLVEEVPSPPPGHSVARKPKPEPIDCREPSTSRSRRYWPIDHNDRWPRQIARSNSSTSRDRSKPNAHLGRVSSLLRHAVENSTRNPRPLPSYLRRKIARCKKRHNSPHPAQKPAGLVRHLLEAEVPEPLGEEPAASAPLPRSLGHPCL